MGPCGMTFWSWPNQHGMMVVHQTWRKRSLANCNCNWLLPVHSTNMTGIIYLSWSTVLDHATQWQLNTWSQKPIYWWHYPTNLQMVSTEESCPTVPRGKWECKNLNPTTGIGHIAAETDLVDLHYYKYPTQPCPPTCNRDMITIDICLRSPEFVDALLTTSILLFGLLVYLSGDHRALILDFW